VDLKGCASALRVWKRDDHAIDPRARIDKAQGLEDGVEELEWRVDTHARVRGMSRWEDWQETGGKRGQQTLGLKLRFETKRLVPTWRMVVALETTK